MREKCISQEHNTVSLVRARTQTALSRDKHTNHEAIVPPTNPGLAVSLPKVLSRAIGCLRVTKYEDV